MARIRSINRASKSVKVSSDDLGPATGPRTVMANGWHADIDESVDWYVVEGNPGPWPIRFFRCKPDEIIRGTWKRVDIYDIPIRSQNKEFFIGHIDNEDQFFFAIIQSPDGKWHHCNSEPGYSNGFPNDDSSGINMMWTGVHAGGPQTFTLSIFAK